MALTPVFRRRFVALISTCFGVVSGCALNWDVRSDSGDAGPTADTFVPSDGTAPTDSPSPADADPDSPSVDCTALASDVEIARKNAKDCTVGVGLPNAECSTTLTDTCDCAVLVNAKNASTMTAYSNAVSAYLASCTPVCSGGCPSLGLPGAWACLEDSSKRAQCTP